MSPRSADPWTTDDIPLLTGRTALVTGVTSGLGEVTARELARHGATVVAAARDRTRLAAAVAALRDEVPGVDVRPLLVDLSDLASVRRGAAAAREHGPLHVLVNNAGVMAPPYARTVDGLELQLATNHVGPFALTGLLWRQLLEGEARVVTVSSLVARRARTVPLDDPRQPRPQYRRWDAYAQSKLANLLFTLELDRRCRAAGLPVVPVAAHPGWARTGLVRNGLGQDTRVGAGIADAAAPFLGQRAEQGALPQLMAATRHGLDGGTYVGPDGLLGARGHPTVVDVPRAARDERLARGLWDLSQHVTGVRYP